MTWFPIEGYEGLYELSEAGHIKSVKNDMILSQFKDKDGYYRVNLSKNLKKKQYAVHRLLAVAFIENKLNHPVVNHKDGNKMNNSLDNLEWTTVAMNTEHGYRTGLSKMGEDHYAVKLTDEQVRYIKSVYSPRHRDYGAKPLSELFGVSVALISKIGLGHMRKYV